MLVVIEAVEPQTPSATDHRGILMNRIAFFLLAALSLLATGCGGAAKMRAPRMAPMAQQRAPKPLQRNHFRQDRMKGLTESAMREILDAPVFLERKARVGVVPVQSRYAVDHAVPVEKITGKLARSLVDSDRFEVVTEVTTDWPGETSIGGLRELATRYRAEYLLLYRHRFVEQTKVNGWGWAWLTVVGGLVVPQNTVETAGVLEATLFDVKSGTLLFTLYERVHAEDDFNVWNNDWKLRQRRAGLTLKAVDALTRKVDARLNDLVVARERFEKQQAEAMARTRAPLPANTTAVLGAP